MNPNFTRGAKALSRRLGLYPAVRSAYRSLSPYHRRARRSNIRFYRELIHPRDLCFDIGANVGQSIEALRACDAAVIAVEPNPNCIPVLEHDFRSDRSVTIVPKAVGERHGLASLHFTGAEATASLRADWSLVNEHVVDVEVTTLDELILEFGCPQFLKVDVEGYELEVFGGLTRPVPLLYFEMHGNELDLAGRILDRLSALGRISGVRVVDGDNARWLTDRWVLSDQLLDELGDPAPQVANIIVKMDC